MTQKYCPVCEVRHMAPTYKPFCSKRCADIDLSRWLKGSYAIPGLPADEAEDVPSAYSGPSEN